MALINCSNCGEEISDQATVCPHCNTEIQEDSINVEGVPHENQETSATAKEGSQNESSNTSVNKTWDTAGIVLGIVAVVVGLVMAFSTTNTLSYASFGGDFYTYTYDGIRALEIAVNGVTKAFGMMIALFGGYMVCRFGSKLSR